MFRVGPGRVRLETGIRDLHIKVSVAVDIDNAGVAVNEPDTKEKGPIAPGRFPY